MQMAVEKLKQGIDGFAADQDKLEGMISTLASSVPVSAKDWISTWKARRDAEPVSAISVSERLDSYRAKRDAEAACAAASDAACDATAAAQQGNRYLRIHGQN